jgi:hypothetical protein
MNDQDKTHLLIRFVKWWEQRSDSPPTVADVYLFMETER